MDKYDRAQEADAGFLQQALAVQAGKKRKSISRSHCLECERVIPEARRLAVPGCELCIVCQEMTEDLEGRYR